MQSHPERPTEYESFSALKDSLNLLFAEFPSLVRNARDTNDWEQLRLVYQNLEKKDRILALGRNPHMPNQVAGYQMIHLYDQEGVDHFIVSESGIAQWIDGAEPRTEAIDTWKGSEMLLGRIYEAYCLSPRV
jgi:hypothetical protein